MLSRIYAQLRGDAAVLTGTELPDGSAGRRARRYWIKMGDVTTVKHLLMQHLPVMQLDQASPGRRAPPGAGSRLRLQKHASASSAHAGAGWRSAPPPPGARRQAEARSAPGARRRCLPAHVLANAAPMLPRAQSDAAGDAVLVNSVYLDNSSLELYHARLDKRPGAIALRMRCSRAAPPAEPPAASPGGVS